MGGEDDPRPRAAAYANRESQSTRNPHAATNTLTTKELSKLSWEERVLAQWHTAYGGPISDESKVQFCIHAGEHTFNLADVRLWTEHHKQNQKKEDMGTIYLEFYFDGMLSELEGKEDEFNNAFESMLEKQLQEVRIAEFRKRLAEKSDARRRNKAASCGAEDAEGGGPATVDADNSEWSNFLKRPAQPSNFSIRSKREAGCMLRFLVCQTSISVSSAEVLGQMTFHEHFPVDGVLQESKSTKPLPKWVYSLICFTAVMSAGGAFCMWKVGQAIMENGGQAPGGAPVPITSL